MHDGKIGKALDGHGREMSYGTGKKEIIGPSVQAQGECVIPPAIPADALADFVLNSGGTEADRVRSYVEWQAPDETVKYLEKVASESIFGHPMDGWDVRTNKNRWWVIINPTNLYSQKLFPSLDYTFSFHVGLHTRMMQAEMCHEQEQAHDRMNQLWNRLAGAHATLFKATKVEEFQSVGMKCRECLLFLAQSLAKPEMVPAGEEAPKRGYFIHWCELIANHVAPGSSNDNIRAYLKQVSKSTWQLVSWLTHAQSAGSFDGSIATEATENVLEIFIAAWAKHEAPKQQAKRRRRNR
ncbi:MAG: hypothetical protein ACXWPK_03205 [Isosphaeraceae bacterium]